MSKTKIVIIDKDMKELTAVETVFTHAAIFLCHFHCLMAVSRRLEKAKLQYNYHHYIYNLFHEAVFSENDEELHDIGLELCSIGIV